MRRPPGPPDLLSFPSRFTAVPPHTEVYPRLKFSESALCVGPPDPRIPSFSYGISMIFLPILRSTLGSNSARSRGAPTPRTPGIRYFPEEFLCVSSPSGSLPQAQLHPLRVLRWPPGPLESFIFLRNFKDFPPHTEVYPRLKFSEFALCVGPPSPPNPPSSGES